MRASPPPAFSIMYLSLSNQNGQGANVPAAESQIPQRDLHIQAVWLRKHAASPTISPDPGRALLCAQPCYITWEYSWRRAALLPFTWVYAVHCEVFLGSVDGCRMDQDVSLLSHWPVLPWEVWLPASDSSIDQQGSALLWHYINKPAAETRDCGDRNIYD